MAALVTARFAALEETGRVEFGGGVIEKLEYAFCDSPYVDGENYAAVLGELQSLFYYYKNESAEALSDDELIGEMKRIFDGEAAGDLSALSDNLDGLCREIRAGEGKP